MHSFLPCLLSLFCLGWIASPGKVLLAEVPMQLFERSETHMGTTFKLRFYASNEEAATKAAREAFERIHTLDEMMSDYKPESELNQLNRTAGKNVPFTVSDDLFEILRLGKGFSKKTNGAFDISAAPAIRLWRRARRISQLPSKEQLAKAAESIGYQHITLDAKQHSVLLEKPKMRLDLGGIAKGYAADEALKVLKKHHVTSALVDAGGDMSVGDAPPGEKGWVIGLFAEDEKTNPASIVVHNCGVATSGDAYQFVEIAGKRYSHIIDPRTCQALSTSSVVTVIAPNGTRADALASAFSVLDPEKAIQLADSLEHTEAFVQRKERETAPQSANSLRRYQSKGMQAYIQK